MTECCVIITAANDAKTVRKISEGLVKGSLAACVQSMPISSCYSWKGEIVNDKETLLFIKALKSKYKKIEKFIRDNHPYEVPEIVCLPIEKGYDKYLGWIKDAGKD